MKVSRPQPSSVSCGGYFFAASMYDTEMSDPGSEVVYHASSSGTMLLLTFFAKGCLQPALARRPLTVRSSAAVSASCRPGRSSRHAGPRRLTDAIGPTVTSPLTARPILGYGTWKGAAGSGAGF